MGKLRFFFALWMAKLSIPALKITRHNGTDFPGSLAVKLCPDFLKYIGKPAHIVAVTGTNGKTTAANMLGDVLTAEGKRVLSNRAGSNIVSGISTALLKGCDLLGRIRPGYDLAVLEVDERSAPKVYPYVKPEYIAVTNLFRDSIMRNAHPGYIADILTRSFPRESKLILNADDLISGSVAPENQRVYFGIERLPTDVTACENLLNDMRICPKCAGKLRYEYRRYHHIGRAVCESCGFHSPDSDYLATKVDTAGRTMCIREGGREYPYTLIADSLHNIYNQVTVIAILRQLGFDHGTIARQMAEVKIPASRLSEERIGGVNVIMQMSKDKNALACSRNFDYIRSKPGRKELLVMMNCMGVAKSWSENPSWMYDTDFEFLNGDDVTCLVCAGPRAYDYKLRLLLAGIPEEKIRLAEDEFAALELLPLTPGDDVYILYGVDGMPLAHRVKARLKEMLLAKEGAE